MGSLQGTISSGPWGGPGGNPWSFQGRSGISRITIQERINIKSISFLDANGNQSGIFGGMDPNDYLGDERVIDINWPSEYLISISGTYGIYKGLLVILSLSFKTNLTSHGPFGTNSGESFSNPISDGVIAGFHGRGGYYLDAIGIFVQPGDSTGSVSFGQWGGPGGNPFTFKVGSWIKEINILDRSIISSISFRDSNDHEYGTFGGNDPNNIGEMKTIKIDGPLEFLTSIDGTYGYFNGLLVITSLSFITNLTTHGPIGTASGTSFSIPIESSYIIGFHGKAGYYLDSIGIHVKPRGHMEGIISLGPWGGQGGNPWSYTTHNGIYEIIIYEGLNIKSISFKDTTGLTSKTFGGNNPQDLGERKMIHFAWPSEHLVLISGTYGNFANLVTIKSLSFVTNRNTYGPFGTTSASDTSFSIPIDNSTIIGFHGRAGHYLDNIGIYVKPATSI
ncbi:mannose/glucose-specific lectin-like isoform X3 [Tripterygium wilfordii]|uniref:Mannose/glucose-specific lectin-like isoform X3 n=1 Tax=Tripterygium wilfordii TaxID=458696 RepID=A0A7J7CBW0_TRIWF|nr:mannose/glucose-specific lectin-like [Tripterygium wilfordii]KAF5731592.1 mannose/glucose-specific lectin-like isoform X3 [Tripterygium wilfordii]